MTTPDRAAAPAPLARISYSEGDGRVWLDVNGKRVVGFYTDDPDAAEVVAALRSLSTATLDGREAGTAAVRDVLAERRRHAEAEGWTPEHDDAHPPGELSLAAACYALHGTVQAAPALGFAADSVLWPWADAWWKPGDRRRDLIKAASMLLAEIERMDRALAHSRTRAPAADRGGGVMADGGERRAKAHGDGSVERWLRANRIAVVAMGKHERGPYHGQWKAYDDPLACVCLTELIIQEMTQPAGEAT